MAFILLKNTVKFHLIILLLFKSHRYLIKFLAKLTDFQDDNKMTPGNQAIVLGPNLLWTHTEPYVFLVVTHLPYLHLSHKILLRFNYLFSFQEHDGDDDHPVPTDC